MPKRIRMPSLPRGTKGRYTGACDNECGWRDDLDLKTGMLGTAGAILRKRHAEQREGCDKRIEIKFTPRF